jgi:hypothetical protein
LFDYLGENSYSLTMSTYRRRKWFEQPWAVRIGFSRLCSHRQAGDELSVSQTYRQQALEGRLLGPNATRRPGERRRRSLLRPEPVKAGLVSNSLDYPFWGSECLTRQELLDLIGW